MTVATGAFGPLCIYCDQPERIELSEIWSDHSFTFDTCCEGMHDEVLETMRDEEARFALLQRLGAADHLGGSLRRVGDDNGQLLIDCALEIRPMRFGLVKEFIRQHHDHCAPPVTWRFGASIWNGRTLIGVVVVSRPTSPSLPQTTWLEITRLCVDRSVSPILRYKACSMLYLWAVDEANRRGGFHKIITYTMDSESGMSLRYARFTPEARTTPRSWNTKKRPRVDKTPLVPKIRWARMLTPASAVSTVGAHDPAAGPKPVSVKGARGPARARQLSLFGAFATSGHRPHQNHPTRRVQSSACSHCCRRLIP